MATRLWSLFSVPTRIYTWINESVMNISSRILPDDQDDDDDKKRQLYSMKNLLPNNITTEEFKAHLDRYPNYIRDVYQRAEKERFVSIPQRLEDRKKRFLTKEELIYLDQWIQKRGTALKKEAHVANAKQINRNSDATVKKRTEEAYKHYDKTGDIIQTFEILKELRGVSYARASLLLSVAYPETLPFFSRPLYQWTHWDKKNGWEQEFTWTEDTYHQVLQKVKDLKDKHSRNGLMVKAIDVEKVVFVLKHETLIRALRIKKIKESLTKDENRINDTGQAFVHRVPRKCLGKGDGSVVVKRIPKTPQVLNSRNRFLAEVSSSHILSKKNQDYFVEFLGWNEDKHNLFIAMEYVEYGNLEQNLGRGPWKEKDIKETTRQLLNGLKIMHDHGIVHRDLKPQNILVVSNSPGMIQVKITDFGISKRLSDRKTTVLATVNIGTPGYKAPEVVQRWDVEDGQHQVANIDSRYSYTHKADLWSLGCIIFRMAKGKPLFDSDTEVLNEKKLKRRVTAVNGLLTEMSPSMGTGGVGFVQKLIVVKASSRYDADTALEGLAQWVISDHRPRSSLRERR
ncbi:kinase-like protein [Annulohypoxylon truncatum]|uniref:kinase-like protein n=1 Tax=Annulohypoxylon truncatum TaxID=327061 RepID=UPI002007AE5A|nr:kinase-like protein [Annulohypoxylon truncatum]KAI1206481.1 kinase-like protein [Annulohypoxylon truncatum]